MAAHWVDLRDQGDREPGVGFYGGNRRPQARAASANDGDIGLEQVHGAPLVLR
jgi:hypothetical protein